MNETTPKISVIVPVYKAEAYLHRCVDSLLAQTFTDFEILLIDDGSPDRSGEICDEYARKDSRVRVWHKENGGVSSARNLGIENSNAEWICFVDSDDYVEKSYLDDFGLDSYEADIYLQGYKVIRNNEITRTHQFNVNHISIIPFESCFIEAERKNILNSPWCKLFKVDIIKKKCICFDTSISYGEDHLFVLKYLQFVQMASISDASSYNYVYHNAQSLTRRVVPIKELLHYGVQCYTLQTKVIELMGVADNNEYKSIIHIRLYANMMRSIYDYFLDSRNRMRDFYSIRQTYSNLYSSYVGLKFHQRTIVLLFKYSPSYISLLLFRLLIFARYLK